MADQQHPIALPPELRRLWAQEAQRINPRNPVEWMQYVSEKAAQWGYDQRGEVNEAKLQQARDQELEACCEWLDRIAYRQSLHIRGSHLRAARRPKPPSLKEQALEDLDQIDGYAVDQLSAYVIHDDLKRRVSNIRRALEELPND